MCGRARGWLAWLMLVLAFVLASACRRAREPAAARDDAPKPSAPKPGLAPTPRVLGELGSADAFELVATSDGALAFWVEAGPCAQSLRMQRFDARGHAIAGPTRVGVDACGAAAALPSGDAHVVELAAAAAGGHLGLVWIAQNGQAASVLGSYAADAAQSFAPAQRLSAAEATSAAARGRLSLSAAESGSMRVAFRAPAARCVGQSGSCAQLVTQAHPAPSAGPGRVADTREVQTPCARMLAGALWVSGTWFDAFCALGEQDALPTTQVYAIRPEISYAAALPTLHECLPLGLAPAEKGAVVWGDCGGERQAHLITLDGHERVVTRAVSSLRCRAGRPVLQVSGAAAQSLELRLDEPRDRIELWLPADVAPLGARAAFTGSRLVVVSQHGNSLSSLTYVCQGEQLVPDAAAML